jgi:uncharacterized protein DUF4124
MFSRSLFAAALLAGAAGVLVGLPAHPGSIYKWVDKDGVTHYSGTPPASEQTERLKLAPAPSGAAMEEAQRRLKDLEEQTRYRQNRLDKEADARRREKQQKVEAARRDEDACNGLRSRLALLEAKGRIAVPSTTGGYVWLSDDQITLQIEAVRRQIQELCAQ